jgi:hypothetical protein
MNIKDVHSYRDVEHTKLIETDQGNYWIEKSNPNIYKGTNHFDGHSEIVTDFLEINELLHVLCLNSEAYYSIKRLCVS